MIVGQPCTSSIQCQSLTHEMMCSEGKCNCSTTGVFSVTQNKCLNCLEGCKFLYGRCYRDPGVACIGATCFEGACTPYQLATIYSQSEVSQLKLMFSNGIFVKNATNGVCVSGSYSFITACFTIQGNCVRYTGCKGNTELCMYGLI